MVVDRDVRVVIVDVARPLRVGEGREPVDRFRARGRTFGRGGIAELDKGLRELVRRREAPVAGHEVDEAFVVGRRASAALPDAAAAAPHRSRPCRRDLPVVHVDRDQPAPVRPCVLHDGAGRHEQGLPALHGGEEKRGTLLAGHRLEALRRQAAAGPVDRAVEQDGLPHQAAVLQIDGEDEMVALADGTVWAHPGDTVKTLSGVVDDRGRENPPVVVDLVYVDGFRALNGRAEMGDPGWRPTEGSHVEGVDVIGHRRA
jgi:hypothetical protein